MGIPWEVPVPKKVIFNMNKFIAKNINLFNSDRKIINYIYGLIICHVHSFKNRPT
jgi:hypothetical protein